ncbi:MAG: Gfo/Idh/MocA family oxidoreductase [Nanoarchaeota archaeon]
MKNIYNAAVIGCGRIGAEFDNDPRRKVIWTHAGAYKNSEKTELVSLSDVDGNRLEKAAEKFNVDKAYTDYSEMLKKEDLDIISICAWNSIHYKILKEAVLHNVKGIYCEKPIANNLEETDEMIRLCEENNVKLLVNHWRRFDGFHPKIKEFIDQGNLGMIQQASFYYTAGIANSGSHMFDLMRYFFGDVEFVQAHYKNNKEDPNIDGIVKFKSGLISTVQSLEDEYYKKFSSFIYGAKGAIEITKSGFDLEMYEVRQSDKWSEYKELYRIQNPAIKYIEESFMINGVKHLVDCIEKNKNPISSGKDARESLALICAFHESAINDGKKIGLPLKTSNIHIKSK